MTNKETFPSTEKPLAIRSKVARLLDKTETDNRVQRRTNDDSALNIRPGNVEWCVEEYWVFKTLGFSCCVPRRLWIPWLTEPRYSRYRRGS